MDGRTTVKYLQEYIRTKDYEPEALTHYFYKLIEETGELSLAMRRNLLRKDGDGIKGTIDEELWDVMYYVLAIANCYGIDMEEAIRDKEAVNNVKYQTKMKFEENR